MKGCDNKYPLNKETIEQLIALADYYETPNFIETDPIQIPKRYIKKTDIEISAFLTAWLSIGRVEQIIVAAKKLDHIMNGDPTGYAFSYKWVDDFTDMVYFHRTVKNQDIRFLFTYLVRSIQSYGSLEAAVLQCYGVDDTPLEKLKSFLLIQSNSPQKRLSMFLRWMVRKNSPVDFGIWTKFNERELSIPLDTHVAKQAFLFGLTPNSNYSIQNVKRITERGLEIFPNDPMRLDFALYGKGKEEFDTINIPK